MWRGGEERGDGGFPRRNRTGESDDEHALIICLM